MAFEIEKGLPGPPPSARPTAKYPFQFMAVGDSFFVPHEGAHRAKNAMTNWARKLGFYFVSRVVDGGVRIWRTG